MTARRTWAEGFRVWAHDLRAPADEIESGQAKEAPARRYRLWL
jgi:hypothetical protein